MPAKDKNRYCFSKKAKCPYYDGHSNIAMRVRCFGNDDDEYVIVGAKNHKRYAVVKSRCFGNYGSCPYYREK